MPYFIKSQPSYLISSTWSSVFYTYTCIKWTSLKSKFFSPTDAQVNRLKDNFKVYITVDIKTTPTCFGWITIIIIIPDDGDWTETCWSCFNVSFNVNFKIVFKTIHLCISWWKNFDNIKMHSMCVKISSKSFRKSCLGEYFTCRLCQSNFQ